MIAQYVWRRFGFRGLALILFGTMYVLIGVGVIFNHMRVPGVLYTYLPVWLRVCVWAGSGLLAIVGAVRPGLGEKHWPGRTKQPPVAEIVGFGALAFAPTERAISFAWAMIIQPTATWLTGFAIYLLLTLVIL